MIVSPAVWSAPSLTQAGEAPPELDFWLRDAPLSRFEMPLFFGSLFGDKMHQSFMGGAGLHVRVAAPLSLGVDFGYSSLNYDAASRFGQVMTNDNFYMLDGVLKMNFPGLTRDHKRVKEIDFYSMLGGGAHQISDSWRGTGFIGLGMKVYTKWDWLATRVEIRHHFLTVPAFGGSQFENNLMLMIGPVIHLPPFMN